MGTWTCRKANMGDQQDAAKNALANEIGEQAIDAGQLMANEPVIPYNDVVRLMCEADEATRKMFEDILGCIWLYIDWKYITRQLTTEQKEMFADAVERSSHRLNEGDDDYEPLEVDRWWR